MKKFTLILLLMTAMFTTAMAQEAVDFSTGTFDGEIGGKENSPSYSRWTSANGVTIISTDGYGDTEIGTMKYYNSKFQLDVTGDVTNPNQVGTRYTIIAPEGYILSEIKIKNSSKLHIASIDYGYASIPLVNEEKTKPLEETITFENDVIFFYLRGENGKFVYITSLTITKVGGDEETSINEVEAETEEVIYDLTGRRINEVTNAGIYIINGKKVVK